MSSLLTMLWSEVCAAHPDQWLVLEALEAHSEPGRRIMDRVAVLEKCPDARIAMRRYRELQRAFPQREIFFFHTSNAELEIEEEWVGILRWGHASHPSR